MIPSFIILFREILEISVILSIILAATTGIAGRGRYIGLGILGGLAGSALVAVFASQITDAVDGMGQELFNGVVLLLAASMIAWTSVWMQRHGRELAQKIKQVGASVREGQLPLYSITVVIALSMWREGAEIVLFMTGILSTSTESILAIMSGAFAGAAVAGILGFMIYIGLIKLSNKHLFTVTNYMLMLLAAGMAAAGAGYLVAADMLPALIPQLWDSSHILSEESLLGKVLHAMLGYSERPSGIQLIFYMGTIIIILATLKLVQGAKFRHALVNKPVIATLVTAALILAITKPAQAFSLLS